MTTLGTSTETATPAVSYKAITGKTSLHAMDRNMQKVLEVLANPCDPRLHDHLFQDGLAKNLNLLVVGGALPDDMGYPYNMTSGPAFLERVSASVRLGRLETDFPGLPGATKEKILALLGNMSH